MASLREEFVVKASPDRVWTALSAIGDERQLFRGVVAESRVDGDHRTVTFANGAVVRERIVDIDAAERRMAYAVVESAMGLEHHHATWQVWPDGEGARVVWIADLLPDELAAPVAELMRRGAASMADVLDSTC
jgi:hypothetical protein